MNVTLIGMAGAGKSYIGRRLAEKLGLSMLDVDRDLWEVKYGKPIQEILDEKGAEEYVKEEEQLILEHTKDKDGLLISPPGSVVYQPDALRHLTEISHIVYLKVPFSRIEERVNGAPPRALIGLGRKTLREVYDERCPLYEKYSHFTIDTESAEADDIVADILRFLGRD
ncbi:hypothetical protein A2853_00805 [Candidatus Kaiserbacteria bacterium RIFCSPHIGHO2_01_FULL_55_17]|uniref:Shikimate kinase n=1 Tax=Candidatus Kaiserbacteria bacterium RIFCSPHIGHO2_01_FULL_55_17 TaxID=1798484 RepID=A0A1F6D998_9BACT|nr:MAG: hypothetical protein A2853_00805 [Candidatus Kaiserbacteria bacterium RIFCSPHIGHO2_01_FULL_55_17]